MTDVMAFKALSLATAVVFVVAACTIQLRGGEDAPSPTAEKTTDADGSDLARCRSVTSEETSSYQHCQKVWAENRRRFFGRKDGAAVSGRGDPASGLAPAPKDQSRMLQGYPSIAIPEASKP